MTAELERWPSDERAAVVAAALPPTAASLVTWAAEADAAYDLARKLVTTSFCPQQFRGKPEEAAAAMLAGAEVGLSPLAALRSFDVIQGTAAPRALTLRAVAQAAGVQFVTVFESEAKVEMRARRRGGEWETVVWTIDRAEKLGLIGKENWRKQPQAMLVARATADLARRVAADAILGIGYAVEELDDDPAPPTTVARAEARARTARRRPSAPTPEEPDLDEDEGRTRAVVDVELPASTEPTAEDRIRSTAKAFGVDGDAAVARLDEARERRAVEPTLDEDEGPGLPGLISKAQLKMLHVMLGKNGLATNRDLALALYHDVIGRDVVSSKGLTKDEATRVIDRLVAMEGAPPPEEPQFEFTDDP